MQHVIMEPFSQEWLICISAVFLIIFLVVNLPTYVEAARHPNYGRLIGLVLFLNLLLENWYCWKSGVWDLKNNLPLHLCGISGLLSIILYYKYNETLANLLFYWGITGGIHSLLTPEFDLGREGYLFYGYFVSHGGLLLTSIFMIRHRGFKPTEKSWLQAFVFIQLAVFVIGLFNWLTGSNYMYLSAPPIVDNPLIIGDWPWYILVFEALAFFHFYILYTGFHIKKVLRF
ncbi:MAG: hypothetical protein RLY46_1151 [Bacteroidota bacterium]